MCAKNALKNQLGFEIHESKEDEEFRAQRKAIDTLFELGMTWTIVNGAIIPQMERASNEMDVEDDLSHL